MLKKIAIFAIIIISLCSVVSAADVSSLQSQRDEIQGNLNEASNELNNIQIELTNNLKKVNDMEDKISAYQNDLDSLNVQLAKINGELETVQSKLSNVQTDFNKQMKIFQNRLVFLYEAGDTNYIDVLLKSKNLSDFVSNYYIISEVSGYDKELLDNIKQDKDDITNIQQVLNDKRQSAKTLKDNAEKTIISINNAKVIRDDYINQLNVQELAVQAKIDAYRGSLNTVNSELIQIANSSINADYVGGTLAWPAPGYYTITCPFGMRLHPILKIYELHTGADIGVPSGSDIIAANDGVVVKSEYNPAYGNIIMIDHGGGISTVYAHGSELIAKVGDTVKRGDVIMKSGSTGWSTGPHLHFEIRINGIVTDPLPYITNQDNTSQLMQEEGGASD
ncbi:MAG: peptidoglycan DD-metalloendopeptidase family protein [Firmicutes bacterium]|nr:peptidoglycan DD-metalloendopeptidase family protein [Bacillota bacterium]